MSTRRTCVISYAVNKPQCVAGDDTPVYDGREIADGGFNFSHYKYSFTTLAHLRLTSTRAGA
jgi:hypothetical protein